MRFSILINGDKEILQRNFWKRLHHHQQRQRQQEQQQPQQQQWYQHKQSYITPWWLWWATADFVFADNSLVWESPLQKKINSSDDKKKKKNLINFLFFFYWSIDSPFSLPSDIAALYRQTHTYWHHLSVFVCIVTVAVPIQLNHHAKDSTSPHNSQTILQASWSLCLPSFCVCLIPTQTV